MAPFDGHLSWELLASGGMWQKMLSLSNTGSSLVLI